MKLKEFFSKLLGRYLWGNLLAMAAVLALLVFLTFKWLDVYSHHGEEITVPQLKGLAFEDAQRRLSLLGLECVVADSGYVTRYPAGTVLDQGIDAGARVKSGREVTLTVNASAPPTIVMPDLADNSSLREAQSRLEALGFSLTPPEYINGEKEWVYGVKSGGANVAAGTRVSVKARLTLVVGNGMTDEDLLDVDSLDGGGEYGDDVVLDDILSDGDILE